MNASHVAGGGFGTTLGVLLVDLLKHYGVTTFSETDAVVIGGTFLSLGVGLGHLWAQGGALGLVRAFLHGSTAKPDTAVETVKPPNPTPPVA